MKKVNLEASEHYKWGDDCDGWHLLKSEDISIIKEKMPPGTQERVHFHENSRQFFFIISGEATFIIDGQNFVVGLHEGVEIEPKEVHQICNESSEVLEFILFSHPATLTDRHNL